MEKRMPEFSKGQKRIARYILAHYDKAAYMTVSRLGSIVEVSESTVVRFAIEIGFDGYPEMQRALQELIRTRLTAVQRVDITNNLIGDDDVLDRVLAADAEKIRRTLDEIDRSSFEAAVDKIISAKSIYIIGVRSSSALAGFLNFNFRMILDNVRFVQTTSGSEMFEQIMNIGPDAVEYASEAGADVISITDSHQSPIASGADQLLLARSDMVSFVDSLVAPLSIINAMIVAVARKKPDEIRKRLEKLEQIWDEYDVYDKTQG